MTGHVLSDLHMYTRRSDAPKYEAALRAAAAKSDFIVLNGDLVDFKWSIIGDPTETSEAAIEWLTNLASDAPKCDVHYVLGNHDAYSPFADRLEVLSRALPNMHWHPAYLQLGTTLFHHGDLLLTPDPTHHWHRPLHDQIGVKGKTRNVIYDAAIFARLHKLPAVLNKPSKIAARVAAAVRQSPHASHAFVTDVYVGHTHEPFDAYEIAGLRIHNTGSAMKHLLFNMIRVDVDATTVDSED